MEQSSKIYVAGHMGLVGSAILRRLHAGNYSNIITCSHSELDLTNQQAVHDFFKQEQIEYVFLAAAKVGGILANNTYPAEFIQQNLAIQTNIIHEAWLSGVKHLLFLGSSCIYPRDCPQPIKEEYLLTGPLEVTNRPYALAKIAGVEMCWAYNRQYGTQYLAAMPTNVYGPGDNYDLETSHVVPALIRKMHEAKLNNAPTVLLWGTGAPKREFIYSDDLADACLFLMEQSQEKFKLVFDGINTPPIINIGCGLDQTIQELAEIVKRVVDYQGEVVWDSSKPDGTPRKCLDVQRMQDLGWSSHIGLKQGIELSYDAYKSTYG